MIEFLKTIQFVHHHKPWISFYDKRTYLKDNNFINAAYQMRHTQTMLIAEKLIKQFAMQPHPEGGWFKEVYRSNEYIAHAALPVRFTGERVFSTAICFLLEQGDFSAFHRIKSDECWHFYAGDPLLIYVITQDGCLETIHLGNDVDKGNLFQHVVPANCWFASIPAPGSTFCFVGCTVAPGFDFADFEMASAGSLSALFPDHRDLIEDLCR